MKSQAEGLREDHGIKDPKSEKTGFPRWQESNCAGMFEQPGECVSEEPGSKGRIGKFQSPASPLYPYQPPSSNTYYEVSLDQHSNFISR